LPVKIARLLLVVALLSLSASVVLADGVDPLVGIGHGNGSTPITLTNPNPTFTLVTEKSSVCTITGDVCGVIPAGMPDAGMIPVFQNDLGQTIATLTIFLQNGSIPLNYQCNQSELTFFSTCTTVTVAGGTDVIFSGGTGVPALIFYPDGDSDDAPELCPAQGPTGPGCADDFVPTEFTVDIEGIITTTDATTNDLPPGITIQGSVNTTPEPSSALMLLVGVLAFALTKVVRRAA